MNRRSFCIAVASAVPAIYAGKALSASLSNEPITLIVPFSPGGNLDTVARSVAPTLADILGVSVVVENKPGAGGVIGAAQVARAKPDGHRSEEHTSELQSLMRNSYAVFCLKKKNKKHYTQQTTTY